MNIYVAKKGQPTGPFTPEQLSQQLAAGELKPTAKAWHEGLTEWIPVSQINWIAAVPAVPAASASPVPKLGTAPIPVPIKAATPSGPAPTAGIPSIVRLHMRSGTTHFVVIVGKRGFDYLIRDPGAGFSKGVYPLRELTPKIDGLRFYEGGAPVRAG